jgi:hypothetical protein
VAVFALAVYFEYKKKMAMIEKGLIPEEDKEKQRDGPENKLAWGIAILGIGISLIISWIFNLDDIVMVGLIFTSIGISILVSYLIAKKV